ncbi:hypothetical protein H6G80_31600 [Nostoc sp. FACHB-87]|uniref:hypothetical protein n=1 Tax=Nostocales TaxID=1161 RepID=UPI00168584AA|nr:MULTISPECIES: hypothetical protein [Nostocales]MBD2299833.1 hypothetical protein [Nostoc sp. FACHB-190]MBD2458598.1 hypothetical protein [Nostoc sp. FACHB-87]MBD2479740.1 hypothetical protein [Anabaena sp. FACHB-83]MBD2490050.1 hypothetical protein [Aulosira sp. FACHB-615]
MIHLISQVFSRINSLLNQFQVKQFVAVVLVGFLVLTTNANIERGNTKAVTRELDRVVHQDKADRPKTTGEWNREARQTENDPGKRAERIAKESAEAVKQWGSVYPDTAKRSANSVDENTR